MARTLTNEDVKKAIQLYRSLPAAVYFRGQTGYGLIVEDEVEKVGEIKEGGVGIWKPMYFFITGGEKRGRRTLTAKDVKTAVEAFQDNELWAVLRVTTGKGFKLVNNMPELVDVKEAESEIIFELTHFGGRSIVPRVEVVLSELQDPAIKWQSGFLYQSEGNKAPALGKNLILTRVLSEEEFESEERELVWQDLEKEVKRLMLFHCDSSSLPRSREDNYDKRVRTFLSQELTQILENVQIDRKQEYEYGIRKDGTVVVQRSVRRFESESEEKFAGVMEEFVKECWSVYFNSCKSLTDAQKQKLGKPATDIAELIEADIGEFERDEWRSTETEERLITWIDRAPGFPYVGWNPEKDKEYFLFQHAWGRGFRVSPGPPRYEWRYTDNGDGTYSKVEFRIEYDGTEKEIPGSRQEAVTFRARDEYVEGEWVNKELVLKGEKRSYVLQIKTDHKYHYKEIITASGTEIGFVKLEDKTEEFTFERKVLVTEWELRPQSEEIYRSSENCTRTRIKANHLLDHDTTWVVIGHGQTPEGEKITQQLKVGDDSYLKWDQVPKWLRDEQEAKYPICECGRERYDKEVGETKCQLCREYRDCPRCGKLAYYKPERIEQGANACDECDYWYVQKENWIHIHLGTDGLEKIRKQAQEVLQAPKFMDYPHKSSKVLFELADGVYTTDYSEELLAKFAELPDDGNDLVCAIWWIIKRGEEALSSDFKEERVQELKTKLETDLNIFAKFVRASNEVIDEVKKLREELKRYFDYSRLATPHPFDSEKVDEIYQQWKEVSSGTPTAEKLAVLRKLRKELEPIDEYREKLEKCRKMAEEAVKRYYSYCPLCGQKFEDELECDGEPRISGNDMVFELVGDGKLYADGKPVEEGEELKPGTSIGYFVVTKLAGIWTVTRYSGSGNKLWTEPIDKVGKWIISVWEAKFVPAHNPELVIYPEYDEWYNPTESAVHSRIITNTGKVIAECRISSGGRKRYAGEVYILLWDSLGGDSWGGEVFNDLKYEEYGVVVTPQEAESRRQKWERELARQRYQEDLRYAEEQVKAGEWLILSFKKGKNSKTGEEQWECERGNRKNRVHYVVSRWSRQPSAEGLDYFCSIENEQRYTNTFSRVWVRLEPPFPEDKQPETELELGNKISINPDESGESVEEKLQALKERWGAR